VSLDGSGVDRDVQGAGCGWVGQGILMPVAGSSAASVRLPGYLVGLLEADPGIDRVELVGSRARGDALPQSDWDFKITTNAFVEVREHLAAILRGCIQRLPSRIGSAQPGVTC
jgi:hypothetical protein